MFCRSLLSDPRALPTRRSVADISRLLLGSLMVVLLSRDGAGAVRVEAYSGAPLGVGRVSFVVDRNEPSLPLSDERFTIQDPDGRVLYAVVRETPVRQFLRRILEVDNPISVTMLFLIRGEGPLEMTVYTPSGRQAVVTPVPNPRAHRRLLDEWWEQWTNRWEGLMEDPQFPPVVENYLTANLARRLGRPLPGPKQSLLGMGDGRGKLLGELFAGEAGRLAIDRQMVGEVVEPNQPLGPLPRPMPWYGLEPPERVAPEDLPAPLPAPVPAPVPARVEESSASGANGSPAEATAPEASDREVSESGVVTVSRLATHVPAECFYVRFGTFLNYLWFRDLSRKWQGDLQNMVLRRAIDRHGPRRLEEQLSLRESALAKVLGPQVINDVALIGLDPFFTDGAAFGILFEARNNFLLSRDLQQQRREALARHSDATEQTVEIAGHQVSLISTPSGVVRSYYAQDESFHLVTTSRQLALRFLQAGKGVDTLAASPGFLHVRQRLPADRQDTVFAYFSPEWFRSLTSPAIWIESQRRLKSVREATLIQLARYQAAAEGSPAADVASLIEAGYLPGGFGLRGDDSRLMEQEGQTYDSLRGRPGTLLPVADVETTSCTASEAAAYRKFADRFRQEIGQVPPLAIAVKRTPLESHDQLQVDLVAAPLEGVKLGKLADSLGPPAQERMAPVEEDLVHFEVVLEAVLPLLNSDQSLHHLFGALQDAPLPLKVAGGSVDLAAWREHVRGYLGAWPKPGILSVLSAGVPFDRTEPQDRGGSIWGQMRDDVLLVSLRPEVIRQTLPQLQTVPAERPAQVWIDARPLPGTQLEPLVHALGYQRAREASTAASRLMNTLGNQLHVPRNECRELAETLVDGQFFCPLGGEYQLVAPPNGLEVWSSSAITAENRFLLSRPPADFQMPLLTWLGGVRGDLQLADKQLSIHLQVEMDKSAAP
jgi:hypothetical protein